MSISTFFPFCGWVISHCMNVPQFVYPVICWKFRLFPLFDYYDWCCCDRCKSLHECAFSFLFDTYWRLGLAGHTVVVVVTLCLTFRGTARFFPQRYFTFPLTMYVELRSPALQADSSRSQPPFNGWQCMRVPISPHPLQLLLPSSFLKFF